MAMERERQLEVAERIRHLRGPKPQPVIAEQVGVGLRAYQHWEAGGGISWENVQRLADVFNVSENYLLYGEEEAAGPATQLDAIEQKIDRLLALLGERQLTAGVFEPVPTGEPPTVLPAQRRRPQSARTGRGDASGR